MKYVFLKSLLIMALAVGLSAALSPNSSATYNSGTTEGDTIPPVAVTLQSVVVSGANLVAHWTKNNDSDFAYYKFAASETDQTPVYPDNYAGWASSNQDTTSFSAPLSSFYAGASAAGGGGVSGLKEGHSYYTAMCVKDKSGNVSCSNTLRVTIPVQPIEGDGFFAYAETFKGGANVALGDVDGDGKNEIITGPGTTGGPHLRVFEGDGTATAFNFFPFHPDFRGGLTVAAGDLDGDGIDEIIVGQASKGEAWVKAYKVDAAKTIMAYFRAYGAGVETGVNVAAGDVDGDGKDEIITGPGNGGGPHLRVFEGDGTATAFNFFPFHPDFRGGLSVGAGDVDADGVDEIVAGQQARGESWVKVYEPNAAKTILGYFRAFGAGIECGVNVNLGDTDADGKAEILAGAGVGGGPQVRVFEKNGVATAVIFFAYDSLFRGGVNATVGNIDGDAKAEIVTGPGLGGGPNVRMIDAY